MNRINSFAFACALIVPVAISGCSTRDAQAEMAKQGATREAKLAEALADSSGSSTDPIARWMLPKTLREISGVAVTGNGHMLAHGDENGVIWEIDYRKGVLVKQFIVGKPALHADLEGITKVGDRFFVIDSHGTLYAFREGGKGSNVNYDRIDTNVGKECEFEGVAYDKTIDALLLACKNIRGKDAPEGIRIYRWPLNKGAELGPLDIPMSALTTKEDWKKMRPSDISVDPNTGNYVLISSLDKALIVLTPSGEVVRAESLPKGHAQPEGVAVTADHLLIVTDEAATHGASVTLYRWP